jgi:hypothetical protein
MSANDIEVIPRRARLDDNFEIAVLAADPGAEIVVVVRVVVRLFGLRHLAPFLDVDSQVIRYRALGFARQIRLNPPPRSRLPPHVSINTIRGFRQALDKQTQCPGIL